MAKSKMMKTVGAVVSGVLILGVADFLTARNFAPNPLYKKRGYTPPQQAEPELPPLDLSKLKISDTKKVMAERDAKLKESKLKQGIRKANIEKAKLEQKANKKNDAKSMMKIGKMYEGFDLGDPDITQAMYWYKKAADTGNAKAKKHLAILYLSYGKPEDMNQPNNQADNQPNNQTLSLNTTKGLGEALTPAAKEMYNSTTTPQTPPEQPLTSNTPPYEQTYASQKITELFSGDIGNKEFFNDPKIPDGEKRKMLRLLSPKKWKD